ncbi:hypothetical protein CAOG_06382 [Capsaspora owczarzaki ATCC 30864]|uniref:Uncharacterized protein n=1 Tax=Capsaspora owczarzaki (strain ATCC 30864) TaxID=595528 RepID=A0A0D2VWP8_CAPO3|nr:hypothetical protein CAOG_06382 [Capsaspora owczarzaki ATCC 30864]KJE96007.1 hypothetical protein CAOG_006382 [Capsaspora owczarzaki ATCC 30864]|eukprot:XP_004345131.1 hypothetical protein CAOG_06382 [Capsaspora owczarzaki ATCC 30864]
MESRSAADWTLVGQGPTGSVAELAQVESLLARSSNDGAADAAQAGDNQTTTSTHSRHRSASDSDVVGASSVHPLPVSPVPEAAIMPPKSSGESAQSTALALSGGVASGKPEPASSVSATATTPATDAPPAERTTRHITILSIVSSVTEDAASETSAGLSRVEVHREHPLPLKLTPAAGTASASAGAGAAAPPAAHSSTHVLSYSWEIITAPFSAISSAIGALFALASRPAAKNNSATAVRAQALPAELSRSLSAYDSKGNAVDFAATDTRVIESSTSFENDGSTAITKAVVHTNAPYLGLTPSLTLVPRKTPETQPVAADLAAKRCLRSAAAAVLLTSTAAPSLPSVPLAKSIPVPFAEAAPFLATGDIILFHGAQSIFSETIELGSWSQFSHVGMVLTPPHFLALDQPAAGSILMFESGWDTEADVEDHKIKFGVSIVPFTADYVRSYTGRIYVRRLMDSATRQSYGSVHRDEMNRSLALIHQVVYNKPYDTDPMDFIRAELKLHYGNTRRTDMFFCSSFLAYVLYELNLLVMTKTNGWVLYTPKDFSSEVPTVVGLKDNVYLESEIELVA